jgi:hypothetical protein
VTINARNRGQKLSRGYDGFVLVGFGGSLEGASSIFPRTRFFPGEKSQHRATTLHSGIEDTDRSSTIDTGRDGGGISAFMHLEGDRTWREAVLSKKRIDDDKTIIVLGPLSTPTFFCSELASERLDFLRFSVDFLPLETTLLRNRQLGHKPLDLFEIRNTTTGLDPGRTRLIAFTTGQGLKYRRLVSFGFSLRRFSSRFLLGPFSFFDFFTRGTAATQLPARQSTETEPTGFDSIPVFPGFLFWLFSWPFWNTVRHKLAFL